MSELEDKLLNETNVNYCSSSSEDENENDYQFSEIKSNHSLPLSANNNYSTNTGPKGVLNDWSQYKKYKKELKEAKEAELLKEMKKFTCKTYFEEQNEEKLDEDDDDDPFIQKYFERRMKEMIESRRKRIFGTLINIKDGKEFLNEIEKEKDVTVICHIYNSSFESCIIMNKCLSILASEYPFVKFCSLEVYSARMSNRFAKEGVPAILIYKNGELIGNFVRLTDELGEEFFAVDIETFLNQHGFLHTEIQRDSIVN